VFYKIVLIGLILTSEALSCVGARPAGLGYAFSAVDRDINCCYWNPAGLAEIEGSIISFTYSPDSMQIEDKKIHIAAYPYFIAVGFRNTALVFVDVSEHAYSKWRGSYWLYLAFGRRMSSNFSMGIKIGYRDIKDPSFEFFKEPTKENLADIPMIFDIGFLYKKENINWGLLIQGLGNIRPAVSIRVGERILINYDLYDIFSLTEGWSTYRIGIEYKIKEGLFIRYGISSGHPCFGIGYSNEWFSFDYALRALRLFLQGYYYSLVSFNLKF
jgi:hypothetical protein